MGIMSLLVKGGSKALNYGKRIAKVAPEFLLGDSSEVIGKAMKKQTGSIWQKGKAGFKALEDYNNAQTSGFFTRVVKNLKNTPKDLINGYKTAATTAKAAGKSGLLAGIKGTGKAFVKKMPFIGAVITLGMEIPNIYRAFKDGGFKAGMKEIGGAGVELGCMAAGSAIGTAICPGIGTAIGAVVGGIVGMFARGKTHTEKKAEQEAAQAEAQQVKYSQADIKTLKECGLTEDEIAQLEGAGYPAATVQEAIAQELKAIEKEQAQTQNLYQEPIQTYDPTQAYAYNNLNTVPQTGFNNIAGLYPNMVGQDKYANDIYYQQIFGTTPTINPFNEYINNQYQYYV